ncbi:MAG: N-6 DNA methylase [bacterium]
MVDNVIQGKTRSRREFCSFYTESDPILTYMVNRLDVNQGDFILEPCAGDGVFIEKILASSDKEYKIDAVDLNPKAVSGLKLKFTKEKVKVWQADTLLDFKSDLYNQNSHTYSKIIGNPPYGAWQDTQKRELLKEIYGGYVKETYTLFIRKCIDLLSENGRLVFIVPDTFLALHMHQDTRKKILQETKVEEILLIPSSFFPGVNFGYSNLCIISFVKTKPTHDHEIKLVSVKRSIDDLYELADRDYSAVDSYQTLVQSEVLQSDGHSFLIGGNKRIRSLLKESVNLGSMADCVTGFYSGNNKKYIVAKNDKVRGSKGYTVLKNNFVDLNSIKSFDLLDGVAGKEKYIPYLKNAIGTFLKDTEWYIRWDKNTVKEYKRSKVARFQNSKYYFRDGIGVPMVKSSKIHAILLEKRIFDQSVVGIFPKDKKYQNYLLAFLNSETCSILLKVINHTANNSANYLKKLPIIINENAIKEVDLLIETFFREKNTEETLVKVNKIFKTLYNL